jgi:cytochrome c peroxidase
VLGFVDVPLGPTGIAVDAEGQRVVVWSQFARQLTVIAATGAPITLASIRVPAERPVDSAVARGRELFFGFDKRISGDGRVCASCHPDGRDDGLVWTTPDGPRQTPMLAGRLDGSAPYGWTGASRDVHTHLTKTFARLGGSGLGGADKDALVAFVKSMQAPRAAKVDAAVAKRGKAIFESEQAACSSCHGDAGDLPDGERHNVRSWAKGDVIGLFDTPSLRGVGGTAPYFHDGRYRTLHQLLSRVDGTMGHTKQLSPDDMNDLETYLRTL